MADQHDRLGKAAREWAERFRDEPGKDPESGVLIELAIDAADMADRARSGRDDRLYLAAATRLQQLIRAANDNGRGAGLGPVDPWAADMARAMGATPGLGNSPES